MTRPSHPHRIARHAAVLVGSFATAGLVSAGCGASGSAPTNVYLSSTLGSSATGAGTCTINEPGAPFLSFGASPGSPINTGSSYLGTTVNVTCSVHSTGGENFEVAVSVTDVALGGVTFTASVTYNPSSPDTPQPVTLATFSKTNGGSWDTGEPGASPCTFALTTQATPPITSGRVWGTLTCPAIVDGSDDSRCAATAEVVVDNCAE